MGLLANKIENTNSILTAQAERQLRDQYDPSYPPGPGNVGKKLSVKKVFSVAERDERGLVEILYIDYNDTPWTVWVSGPGREVQYIEEGW